MTVVTIILSEMTRESADAILASERPGDVRVADDYPTEFSVGVAQYVGAERQFGPFVLHRSEDEVVVGEIGGAFVDEEGTIEIGYAVVESQWNRGYATAAVEALVAQAREASEVRRIVANTPLERPQSGRVLEKAGFAVLREMDDADESGNVVRVKLWELTVQVPRRTGSAAAGLTSVPTHKPATSTTVTASPASLASAPLSTAPAVAPPAQAARPVARPCSHMSGGSSSLPQPAPAASSGEVPRARARLTSSTLGAAHVAIPCHGCR